MKSLQTIIFICFMGVASLTMAVSASDNEGPRIAKWYRNYDGAVSLRFDDTLDSHIKIAIPLLNRDGFKATFMVNPGLTRYRENKDFWEQQAPAMGHSLGNHTMNHRGALNPKEAEYEIGEAARTIWRVCPQDTKLLVFASGGGEKWGGKDWEQADPAYTQIAAKYHQIDLYDGKHTSYRIDARSNSAELCNLLERTAEDKRHQPFHFHQIGSPLFKDIIRSITGGQDLSVSEDTFSAFLRCLEAGKPHIWVAPLIDILKYEEEARSAGVKVLNSFKKQLTVALTVKTDVMLYDHKLTLVLPIRNGMIVKKVTQGKKELPVYQQTQGESLVDVKPQSSTITITFTEA